MALSVVGGFGSLAPIFFGIYGQRQSNLAGVMYGLSDFVFPSLFCCSNARSTLIVPLPSSEGISPDKISRLLTWPSLFTGTFAT